MQFKEIRHQEPMLERFSELGALVEILQRIGGDLNEKDAIYAALVRVVQGGSDGAQLSMTLLWVGLWGGLDAVFRRRLRLFATVDEATSEIASCFAIAITRAELARIRRVAATLILNTERILVDAHTRATAEEACRAKVSSPVRDSRDGVRPPPILYEAPTDDVEHEVSALGRWLCQLVTRDADLVLSVAIVGETQREVAERLGLTYEVARKRYERALGRLREHLQEALERCPNSRRSTAFLS